MVGVARLKFADDSNSPYFLRGLKKDDLQKSNGANKAVRHEWLVPERALRVSIHANREPLLALRNDLSEFALTHLKRAPRVAEANLGEDSRKSNVSD